jgi:phage-related protein
MSKLKIGWGEADITPDNRVVELAGQYYQRIADGIHSRLKTVAMLLEQKKNTA